MIFTEVLQPTINGGCSFAQDQQPAQHSKHNARSLASLKIPCFLLVFLNDHPIQTVTGFPPLIFIIMILFLSLGGSANGTLFRMDGNCGVDVIQTCLMLTPSLLKYDFALDKYAVVHVQKSALCMRGIIKGINFFFHCALALVLFSFEFLRSHRFHCFNMLRRRHRDLHGQCRCQQFTFLLSLALSLSLSFLIVSHSVENFLKA